MKHSLHTHWLGTLAEKPACSLVVLLAQLYVSVNIKINEQWFGVEYNEAVKIKSSASASLTSSSWG